MNIYVSQIYPEAGVNYPFTHRFQQFISKALTNRIASSESFVRQYGDDFDLIFRMSAKSGIQEPEIKGPTVFRRDKDVEYTVFLPYGGNAHDLNSLGEVVSSLISAIIDVLDDLGFDTTNVSSDSAELIKQITGDAGMVEL